MWYFAWILGLGFAASLGIINALWYEFQEGGYDIPSGVEHTTKVKK